MEKVKFGNIISAEGEMPVLEVLVVNDANEVTKTKYLSPFRCYSFQVSDTPKGEGDCGSSLVIGLARCIVSDGYAGPQSAYASNVDWRGISIELLRGQVAIAVTRFCQKNMYHDEYISPNMKRGWNDDAPLEQFLNRCYDYIKKHM